MDPKMDSGYLKPGDEFEETYDVSRPLQPEEVLGIIDQLLCFEVNNLTSSAPAQKLTAR